MNITIKLNKQQCRRLAVISKSSPNILILVSNAYTAFISDNYELFKAVTFPGSDNSAQAFSIASELLAAVCIEEGSLSITIDGETISLLYLDNNRKVRASGTVSRIPMSRVSDLARFMNLTDMQPYKLNAFKVIKHMIGLCSTTSSSLTLSNELAYTSNNNLKVFANLADDNIQEPIGITLTSLKEIDKFKVDGNVYSIQNYILLTRPGYILGIRKANVRSMDIIPQMYLVNDGATSLYKVQLEDLVNFVSGLKLSTIVNAGAKCVLDLYTNEVHINLGSQDYMISVKTSLSKGPNTKIKRVEFSLEDFYNLRGIFSLSEHEKYMALYSNGIMKLQVDNINVLARCKF